MLRGQRFALQNWMSQNHACCQKKTRNGKNWIFDFFFDFFDFLFLFQIELSIEICYCFEDKCNHPDSLAMTAAASSASSSSSTYGNFVNLYLLFLRQDIKWMSFSISGFIFKAFYIMLVKCVDSELDPFVWHSF